MFLMFVIKQTSNLLFFDNLKKAQNIELKTNTKIILQSSKLYEIISNLSTECTMTTAKINLSIVKKN